MPPDSFSGSRGDSGTGPRLGPEIIFRDREEAQLKGVEEKKALFSIEAIDEYEV